MNILIYFGFTVYTDGQTEYAKKSDGKYYTFTENTQNKKIDGYDIYKDSSNYQYADVKNDAVYKDGYYTVSGGKINYGNGPVTIDPTTLTQVTEGNGTYDYTEATTPPDPSSLTEAKETGTGEVAKNEVVTDASGQAVIRFNEAGTYYVVETEAPAGYEVDSTPYTFVVDEELKSITLENANEDHSNKWYKIIWDLFYGTGTYDESNWTWTRTNRDDGRLTVKNEPIRANVLISKVWDDDNDRDGLRRNANERPKVKLQKTTDPSDSSSWVDAPSDEIAEKLVIYTDGNTKYVKKNDGYHICTDDGSGGYNVDQNPATQPDPHTLTESMVVQPKTIPDHDDTITVDLDNYYTWSNLPAYENGNLLYYRVVEFDGELENGAPFLPGGDHPEETAYTYTTKTAVGDEEEFNIANVTDPDNPTSRNRTVIVTNKHIPEKMKISVSKEWANDDNDKGQRRTANVTLYKNVNGVETVYDSRPNIVPDGDTQDSYPDIYTWDNLPAYENGYPVTYRVKESDIDHYETAYTRTYTDTSGTVHTNENGDSIDATDVERTFTGTSQAGDRKETTAAGFTIKNSNLQELKVYKTWIDGANANVTYEIYRTTSTNPDVIDWDKARVPGTGAETGGTKWLKNMC